MNFFVEARGAAKEGTPGGGGQEKETEGKAEEEDEEEPPAEIPATEEASEDNRREGSDQGWGLGSPATKGLTHQKGVPCSTLPSE